MEEGRKKKNTGLIVTIIILILIIVGMGVYIAYDKGVIFKTSADVEEKKGKVEKEVEKEEPKQEETQKPIGLDSDKCINIKDFNYTAFYGLSGVTARLSSDKKSVNFSGRWDLFDGSQPTGNTFEYNINNFEGEIAEVLIGSFGQDNYHSAIIYLMSDGTVEYTPIRKAKESNDFKSYGKVNGVEDIVRIKTVFIEPKNSPTGGGVSIIAQKADGTFYNLSEMIDA